MARYESVYRNAADTSIFFCFAFGVVALIEAQQNHSTGLAIISGVLFVAGVASTIRYIRARRRDAQAKDRRK
jgi:uncharacterized membrane protein